MRGPFTGQDGEAGDALMRLWEETRPLEPSDAAWEAVWTRVRGELDRPRVAVTAPKTVTWRRFGAALFMTAQAAAVLAAVVVASSRHDTTTSPLRGPIVSPLPVAVDIAAGQIVMIHSEGNHVRVEKILTESPTDTGDGYALDLNGDVEGLTREEALDPLPVLSRCKPGGAASDPALMCAY